jgi:regulator of protease activity HflC (stomatin/prohibitin superfamily)
MNKGKKTALSVVIAVFALILVMSCFAYVPVGSTGVVKNLGAPSGKILTNGVRIKAPFVQSVEMVNNQIQKLEVDANAVSKDLQAVTSRIAVNFSVRVGSSVDIVRDIGALLYMDKILAPAVQESVKSATARYTAEGLITERAKVGAEIAKGLEEKVSSYGIDVREFNIVNFDFSEAFNKAIEEKQVAQQELIRVRTEQEQLVVKAEAQAEANRKLAESLTTNLVEYEKVKKWDGILPKVSGGGAIVDFREP